MGTSNIQGLIDWTFDKKKNNHSQITLIIQKKIKKKVLETLFFRKKLSFGTGIC